MRTKNYIIYLAVGVIALSLSGGCASAPKTPAKVEGTRITDPAVGFKGITLQLPETYRVYTPLPKEAKSAVNAQWAWNMSTNYDRAAGNITLEQHAFESGTLGITMATVQLTRRLPPDKKLKEQEGYMQNKVDTFRFGEGEIVISEVRLIGGRYVACVARKLPSRSRYNIVYMVPVTPSYLLVFNGVSMLGQENQLIADLEQAIASLKG